MDINVKIDGKSLTVPEGSTVEQVARTAGFYPDAYIFLRNNVPVPVDLPLNEGDSINLLRVASGG